MDRYVKREPRLGNPQRHQMNALPSTSTDSNNINVAAKAYQDTYEPGFPNALRVNNPGIIIQNPGQIQSGIDPQYLASYDGSTNYLAGQQQNQCEHLSPMQRDIQGQQYNQGQQINQNQRQIHGQFMHEQQQISGQQQSSGEQYMHGQQYTHGQQLTGQQVMHGQLLSEQQYMQGQQLSRQQNMHGKYLSGQKDVHGLLLYGQQNMQGQTFSGQQNMHGKQLSGQQYMHGQQQFLGKHYVQPQQNIQPQAFQGQQCYKGQPQNQADPILQNIVPETTDAVVYTKYMNKNVVGAVKSAKMYVSGPHLTPTGKSQTQVYQSKHSNISGHASTSTANKESGLDNVVTPLKEATSKSIDSTVVENDAQNLRRIRLDKIQALNKSGPRAFSGPVEKVLKWHKVLKEIGVLVLYEIVAKCLSIRNGKPCEKILVIKDENGPAMEVVYYEIDFLLPKLTLPCTIRLVGRMLLGTRRLQAFSVRTATSDDIAMLPRRAALAQHHITKLAKEYTQ